MANTLSQSTLQEWFRYDPKKGKLFWKKSPPRKPFLLGQEAGCVFKPKSSITKYRIIGFQNKNYRTHNLIWILYYGYIPNGFEPDHIDHNGLNNLLDNLRLVTHIENGHNVSMHKNNKSGITGVCYLKKKQKWKAQITINHKTINLGFFDNIADAVTVRKKAETKNKFHKNHGI